MLADFRRAARAFRRAPGFFLLVVLPLALGIGATTAIFSAVHGVLLRPLPYRAPGQLVTVNHFYPSLKGLEAGVSAPGFRDYRDRTRSFARVAVGAFWQPNLTGQGEPERLTGAFGSGDYFAALGVQPALGRAFGPDEDAPGRAQVVVLSDGFWRRRLGADPRAVGRTLVLNGRTYQVVGVMPPGFADPFVPAAEVWRPLALSAEQLAEGRTNEWLSLVARLRPGVEVGAARAELRTLAEQLKRAYPDSYPADWSLTVASLQDKNTGRIRPALLVLLGAVGFVLLIAAANVANLLLARGAGRAREVAVRTALGARRAQLARQMLAESVVLAAAAGALGAGLAAAAVRALAAFAPATLPAGAIRVDAPVLGFALAVSLGTGLLFGLAPAAQAARGALSGALREGGRGAAGDRGAQLVRRGLVVAEVALALVLLTGAGLLTRSFARLQGVDPGFEPRGVLTFTVALPQAKYPSDTQRVALFDALLPRVAAVRGVRAAGAVSELPFGPGGSTGSFAVEGYQAPPGQPGPWGDLRVATPGYFEALRIPLRRGRLFTAQDAPGARRVAVVDEELAARYWPGQNPIGRRVSLGAPDGQPPAWIEVVGVVGHAKQEGLDADARVQLYLPFAQSPTGQLAVAVRAAGGAAGDPERLLPLLRAAVREVDRDLPLADVRTLESRVDASVGPRRLSALLLGGFATLALVMASLGLYGVMAYAVAQRTRELGVRLALGAARGNVLGLVLRQGLTLALAGGAVGLAGALALSRLLQSQLYGVRAADPATLAGVVLLLGAVAFVAALVPARRATRVDPAVALRGD
jgi:predicted permease